MWWEKNGPNVLGLLCFLVNPNDRICLEPQPLTSVLPSISVQMSWSYWMFYTIILFRIQDYRVKFNFQSMRKRYLQLDILAMVYGPIIAKDDI